MQVPLTIIAIFSGIIIDSFGMARAERAEAEDDMQARCFICDLGSKDFQRAGTLTLSEHCRRRRGRGRGWLPFSDHRMWDYLVRALG